jgi:hypothetical protein
MNENGYSGGSVCLFFGFHKQIEKEGYCFVFHRWSVG